MKRILCLRIHKTVSDASQLICQLLGVADWCRQFTPLVGIEQAAAPQCVLLEIGAVAHLFGGEEALAQRIVAALINHGWPITAALADTLGAAWALATYHTGGTRNHESSSAPLVIIPATDPKPTPDRPPTITALHPLPIEALRLPEHVVELLHSLGVWQIAQFERLPRRELLSRFGNELLACWDRAVGRMEEPLPAVHPSPHFTAAWSPEYPLADREAVSRAIEQLAGDLARQLRERGQGVVRLECRLQCSDAEPVDLVIGLFQPTAWAAHLVQLLQVQFENLRLSGPVESVRLTASLTAPLEFRQQELFSVGRPRRHPRQLASLIERLSNRLGPTRVMRVNLVPEAQPELACRYKPWVEGRNSGKGVRGHNMRRLQSEIQAEPGEANSLTGIPPRPVRLLTRPMPLESSRHTPADRSGRSAVAAADGTRSVPATLFANVAHRWGPERIETGWWRGCTAVRDYYRIETVSGRRYWVFRRLTDGQWFLHGVFD